MHDSQIALLCFIAFLKPKQKYTLIITCETEFEVSTHPGLAWSSFQRLGPGIFYFIYLLAVYPYFHDYYGQKLRTNDRCLDKNYSIIRVEQFFSYIFRSVENDLDKRFITSGISLNFVFVSAWSV